MRNRGIMLLIGVLGLSAGYAIAAPRQFTEHHVSGFRYCVAWDGTGPMRGRLRFQTHAANGMDLAPEQRRLSQILNPPNKTRLQTVTQFLWDETHTTLLGGLATPTPVPATPTTSPTPTVAPTP